MKLNGTSNAVLHLNFNFNAEDYSDIEGLKNGLEL